MEKMTRNEAAAYLGVAAQTITNWVNKGLLGGVNDKKSKRFFVNGDDVKKYAEKYKILSVSEELLDDAINKVKESEDKLNEKYERILAESFDVKSFSYNSLSRDVSGMLAYLIGHREKLHEILVMFLCGRKIVDIAKEKGVTETYVREKVRCGFRMIRGSMCHFESVKEEMSAQRRKREDLEKEIALLQDVKIALKEKYAMLDDSRVKIDDVLVSIFVQHIEDSNLSVRCKNCLRSNNINTVCDIVVHSKKDFVNILNFGRKSLTELENFVNDLGLTWNMIEAKVFKKNTEKIKYDGTMDNLIYCHISSIISEMAHQFNLNPTRASVLRAIRNYCALEEKRYLRGVKMAKFN